MPNTRNIVAPICQDRCLGSMISRIGVTDTYDAPGMSFCSSRRTVSAWGLASPRVRTNTEASSGRICSIER
jgi:hypothetical protein